MAPIQDRCFLFLQGPHGPLFRRLAAALSRRGCRALRLGLTPGDRLEWLGAPGPYVSGVGEGAELPGAVRAAVAQHGVTDIVLYDDSRPISRAGKAVGRSLGLHLHCFEEGYLRPAHVTYERSGTNASSRLMSLTLDDIRKSDEAVPRPETIDAAVWGDTAAHVAWSLRYHAAGMIAGAARDSGHRGEALWREGLRYLGRVLALPSRRSGRWRVMRRVRGFGAGGYHLVLLQLSFDAALRSPGGFASLQTFVTACLGALEAAGPARRLVFKTHPFEDGRAGLVAHIRAEANRRGVPDRVAVVDGGGPLAPLLDAAAGVLTVNSTGALHALARGVPVLAAGPAVYAKPGLTTEQTMADFLNNPRPVDSAAVSAYRRFLTRTSQVPGSFYGRAGLKTLLDTLPGRMLDPVDAYDRVLGRVSSGLERHAG